MKLGMSEICPVVAHADPRRVILAFGPFQLLMSQHEAAELARLLADAAEKAEPPNLPGMA